MRTMQVLLLAGLTALCLSGARAAPGLTLAGPATAVAIAPAVSQWSLGLVADGRRTGDGGVMVLAVSPQGTAERIGVRVGDRLLAINGQPLAGVQAPNALFESALAAGDGEVRLEIERDGRPLTLEGRADGALAVQTGQSQEFACGYISALGVPPRVTRSIFQAEITQINGQSTPLQPMNRFRVPAGRHVVVVAEHIDRYRLSRADTLRIHRMQRRERARAFKVLVVDVEPGMRYTVGAELLPDQMDPDSIRANAWWQPVVFDSRPEACR